MDQGSTTKRSAVHNFAPTVTKFCVMWEGQALPHDTKFGNSRCEIIGRRVIFIWSLIHGLRWSGLIKVGPGLQVWGIWYCINIFQIPLFSSIIVYIFQIRYLSKAIFYYNIVYIFSPRYNIVIKNFIWKIGAGWVGAEPRAPPLKPPLLISIYSWYTLSCVASNTHTGIDVTPVLQGRRFKCFAIFKQ